MSKEILKSKYKKYNYVIVILIFILSILLLEENNIEKQDISTKIESNLAEITKEEVTYKVNEIKDKYGIEVRVLDKANYSYYGKIVEKQLDNNRTYYMLNKLDNALEKYPSEIFDQLKSGYVFSILPKFYLVKEIDSNVLGITDKQFANDVKVVIADTEYIYETIHHEMMHVMDFYLLFKYNDESILEMWEKYNPRGFEYKQNNKLGTNKLYQEYFLEDTSTQSIIEDRAYIFETMMVHNNQNSILLKEKENIRQKANLLSNQIKKYFLNENLEDRNWDKLIK